MIRPGARCDRFAGASPVVRHLQADDGCLVGLVDGGHLHDPRRQGARTQMLEAIENVLAHKGSGLSSNCSPASDSKST
jgi:hypothetical protein